MEGILEWVKTTPYLYTAARNLRDAYSFGLGIKNGTFSQHGEDVLLNSYFAGRSPVFYVDIGASHPFRLSNTYLLYRKGWRGITVEPIPYLGSLHRKWRPEDELLQYCIGPTSGTLTFYEMFPSVLSTLDPGTARNYVAEGKAKVIKEYPVEVVTLEALVRRYVKDRRIDFMSIDMEGLDSETLRTFPLDVTRPDTICVEANEERDRSDIREFFAENDYRILSELGCNIIAQNGRTPS